ncbi:MAG: hypothetical protein FWD58_02940 [Firmicutes bacterium]|nr:hypothetical protein [Bacillota bacterium]
MEINASPTGQGVPNVINLGIVQFDSKNARISEAIAASAQDDGKEETVILHPLPCTKMLLERYSLS